VARATTIIHSARKADVDGVVDGFWVLFRTGTVQATGTGGTWRGLPPAQGDSEIVDAAGAWLTPGFIDLHGHGAGGFSFDDGADAIEHALSVHRAHGTTRSVVSLVTNPVDRLAAALSAIADLTARDPLILGAHLEGPFLAPTRKGAHNPKFLIEPSQESVGALLNAARGTLRQVTLAPELAGADAAIDGFTAAGVVVAVGHTEATAEQAAHAFDRGARLLTHAFNAMPGIGHRAPGPVVAALRDPRVTLELILDGIHVHPDVARLVLGAAPERVALVTDAMAAAASSDGRYRLGSVDVVVSDGQARVANPDGSTGSIAGSTLTLDRALSNAVLLAGMPAATAVAALTAVPARVLGADDRLGKLARGYAADAVMLDSSWKPLAVWAEGTRIS
jgi:N-acetylglucosamine-6-phosphate deacetylase